MSSIGLKEMVKLDKKLRAAAHVFAKTNKRQRAVGAGTYDELALIALRNAAFDFVAAALTGDDGKAFAKDAVVGWVAFARSNGSALAAAIKLVKRRPFDAAFKSHEAK